MRLRSVCDVGRGFVPPKFDALETAPMRLNWQNRFRALFSRVKLVSIIGVSASSFYLALRRLFALPDYLAVSRGQLIVNVDDVLTMWDTR